MRMHQPRPVGADLLGPTKQVGMDEIDRAHVEGRWHANFAAERRHPLDEIEARLPEVKTAVDVRPLDVNETARIDRVGEAQQQAHRERRSPAMRACNQFAVKGREFNSHGVKLAARGSAGQRADRG